MSRPDAPDSSDKRIERVDASRLGEVVAVHCEAFRDYPTMRHLLRDSGRDYDERLAILIRLFIDTIHLKGGVAFGVRDESELVAAADTVRHGAPEPPALARRRETAWRLLGEAARRRYERYSEANRSLVPDVPSYYLSMLGIRSRGAGRGLARALVDRVQEVSRSDPATRGVHLETEDRRNVAFYEHLGFELTGHVEVGDGLECWGFFRPDESSR